jgi:hypothetical protein
MNKYLTVHVPQGAGKRAAPVAQRRAEVRLAFSQAAQNISRLSPGVFLSGLSGTAEATPLVLVLFRVFGAVAQWLRPSPKGSAKDQLLLHSAEGHSQGEAGPRDLGSASAIAEPSRNRHDTSFRGIWTQNKSGARFERKRLMRMTHRIPNEDSR